jgi:hypothetical protein
MLPPSLGLVMLMRHAAAKTPDKSGGLVLCQPTFASRGCCRPGVKGTCRSLEASKSEHLPELGELFFGKRPRLFIQVGLIQADEPRAVDPVWSS